MKYISKRPEPEELIKYKETPGVCYEDMASRPAVRNPVKQSLVEEQGYICCYCGRRIANDSNTHIEHLKSQKVYPLLQLCYENMLATCDGGQAQRSARDQNGRKIHRNYPVFCDACKEEHDIPIDPLQRECEAHFIFDQDGQIIYDTDDHDAKETVRRLNLDNSVLNNMRREAIAEYVDISHSTEEWNFIASELMKPDESGSFKPFCFAVYSFIMNFKLPRSSTEIPCAKIV